MAARHDAASVDRRRHALVEVAVWMRDDRSGRKLEAASAMLMLLFKFVVVCVRTFHDVIHSLMELLKLVMPTLYCFSELCTRTFLPSLRDLMPFRRVAQSAFSKPLNFAKWA